MTNLTDQALSFLKVFAQTYPPETPTAVPLTAINFANDSAFQLSMENIMERNFLSMVQAIFVDNVGSAVDMTCNLTFGISAQRIVIPSGCQAYINVMAPNPASITFTCFSGTNTTAIFLLNYPVTNCVWSSGGVNFRQRVIPWLTYSGGLNEPEQVMNYSLVSPQGQVTAATVTGGHAGTGYAIGDTGTISGAGDAQAVYKVLTLGGGGSVATVSITYGGLNYATGAGVTTTVVTGAGDGTLELSITANAIGVTSSVSPLISPAAGYMLGGMALFLSSDSTLTAGTDLQVSLIDSVSGLICTANLSPANGLFSYSLGLTWNNKTLASKPSLILSTSLSAGKLFYTIPYALETWVG